MGENTSDLMEQAELEVLVPYATDFSLSDLEAHVRSVSSDVPDEPEGSNQLSALSSIPPRTTLHFDEQVNVLVVLRTPSGLEELQRRRSCLTINLEAQAFGSESRSSATQDSNGQSVQPQSRDVIWSGAVDTTQRPATINDGSQGALVWSLSCFLSRPRVRMQHPMIFFKISGTLREPLSAVSTDPGDRLLSSGVPASINVLEPLSGDRELQGINPQLTALRLDRISSTATLAATEYSIRPRPQKSFPALPAISARVRYSKPNASSVRPATIASLDIETSPFHDEEIQLTDVNMHLSDGSAQDLCAGHAINLPMICQPRDNVLFLFRLLVSNEQGHESRSKSHPRTLNIWINARVLCSGQCRPNIQMRWRTTVDFSTALNPSYGGPSQAIQRSSRPTSLPLTSDSESKRASLQDPGIGLDSDDKLPQRATVIPGYGVTMTLTGPRDVYVGQPFTWDLFLVNRSDKARSLAILVIPRRKAGDHKTQMSKTSISSTVAGQRRGIDRAETITDENRLYSMQKSNCHDPISIVCLSTDVRIGNLNPGFCHNTELKFLPLSKGILRIEAVRVVDVLTNETIDIRDLPEIVAEERAPDDRESS
ncbi:MAG: hypothetical protein Q9172_004298 [Xanthocarpia lactea]